ncbi:MAG TPA: UvrD-helicase domain-containing protein [bacterium]|nr:UvrD-helicase domain-containing protein [bacterium]
MIPIPNATTPNPPDQAQRDLIRNALDTNLLVEAAAGTGKTTSLIGRMIELLGAGKCSIETLAAVTFTRKAAGELRSRFQIGLEQAAREADVPRRQRFQEALGKIERGFIGTIHSFCGQLLRERPVEAEVDVAFEEIDDPTDTLLRQEVWEEYIACLYTRGDPRLAALRERGLEIRPLYKTFALLADYPDVEEWPAPDIPLPDTQSAVAALREYVAHMEKLLPTLPADPGNDTIMPLYKKIPRMWRQAAPGDESDLMEILSLFKEKKNGDVIRKNWPGKKEQAEAERERWNEFAVTVAAPLVEIWQARRYAAIMQIIRPALELYEQRKQELGQLNFQDLLMKTARLLRGHPAVRGYFSRRWTHLLVDEFQDTDPIQAEVMLLLTATDPHETDWRKCVPRPGSLFVVGDPKQSIYRFRRADIVTYNQVKRVIEETGGEVIQLDANFRTIPPILDWVNQAFAKAFPPRADEYSPVYIPLRPGKSAHDQNLATSVQILLHADEMKNKELCLKYETDFIARHIRQAISRGEAAPGDFLIVTYKTKNLTAYAAALQAHGIPHQVTGGTTLNQNRPLRLLHRVLEAIARPDDPIPLVSVLRGELFGVSDPLLYEFKRAGGVFHYRRSLPDSGMEDFEPVRAAFKRLQQCAHWLKTLPPAAALERIAEDLGLFALASATPGATVECGSLGKAIELLRSAGGDVWSIREMAAYLRRIIEAEASFDGLPAAPAPASVVRIMNLHKVKGLEAPIVFLADPTGDSKHDVELHIDRSGGRTRGYACIFESTVFGRGHNVLGKPLQWEKYAQIEEAFHQAEQTRLLYVAATRAGQQLIISQRAKSNTQNPWQFFEKFSGSLPTLPEPEPLAPAATDEKPLDVSSITAQVDLINALRQELSRPTYDTVPMKVSVLETAPPGEPGRALGAEWGEILHTLLESLMQSPGANVDDLTASLLEEHDLPREWREPIQESAAAVMASGIWRRARAADTCLVEVPVRLLQPDAAIPTVLRGAIDLLFKEKNGWVLVDYKTDQAAVKNTARLIKKYRSQLDAYAAAWERIVSEPVVEKGFFFTATGKYEILA